MNAWVIDAARLSDSPADDPTTRVVIRDVTNEYQTEQIRKDFVANASHELRTPLAIINGYLENLIDDDLLDDKELTRRFLKVMRKHTERISRMVLLHANDREEIKESLAGNICAVIGLKNHGLTITGESLDEIFDRIEGKVLRQVPMS